MNERDDARTRQDSALADNGCTSPNSDSLEQLLAFLDSLEDAEVDGVPIRLQAVPSVEEEDEEKTATAKSKSKAKTKSNTWRQRQHLEVLRLRDEVKQLDTELKKMKLAMGVRSTLPLLDNLSTSGNARVHSKRPTIKKLLTESWQDAASRESLARQMASFEHERLHKTLRMQVKHARRLHRMMTQQMTTAVVAQALGCRPTLAGDEGLPPTDNNMVFRRLLAEMDGHRGNISRIFVTHPDFGRRKAGHVSIDSFRGLQVQIETSYAVPFSMETTEQAIWNVLTKGGISDKKNTVAYKEMFEVDSRTILESMRTFIVTGPFELCFLVRKGYRKYVVVGQTHFVTHETSIVTMNVNGGVSYDEVLWRAVKPGLDRAGTSTSIIETHVLATFPTYKTLDCLPQEGLNGFHDSLMRFNHTVEDVLVAAKATSGDPRTDYS